MSYVQEANKEMILEIQKNKHGHFIVNGELNFSTVSNIQKYGAQLIENEPRLIFDLQHVISEDNSELALLLSWVRLAHKLNKTIEFINAPASLLAIAELSGLIDILPISTKVL